MGTPCHSCCCFDTLMFFFPSNNKLSALRGIETKNVTCLTNMQLAEPDVVTFDHTYRKHMSKGWHVVMEQARESCVVVFLIIQSKKQKQDELCSGYPRSPDYNMSEKNPHHKKHTLDLTASCATPHCSRKWPECVQVPLRGRGQGVVHRRLRVWKGNIF